jgi:hypothetical protein
MIDLIVVNSKDEYAQRMLDFIWDYLYFKTKNTEYDISIKLSIDVKTSWILNIEIKKPIPLWIIDIIFEAWAITGHIEVKFNA